MRGTARLTHNECVKHIIALSFAALAAASAFGQTSPAPYKGPKKRIAVMPMSTDAPAAQSGFQELIRTYKSENNINTVDQVGRKMTEMLTTALVQTGRFVVLERAAIQDVRDEMAVTAELGNDKTAVKKGNVMGAQILVRAAVTEFAPHRKSGGSGISLGGIRVGGSQDTAAVTLDVRFFDPNTSQVLFSETAEGTSKSEAQAIGFSVGSFGFGGGQSANQPIDKATRDAILKAVNIIVAKMDKVPWEGKIAKAQDDGTLILNRGTNDGLKEGDVLQVYKPGEVIKDPDTDAVLGRDKDVYIGEVRITWVSDNVSRGTFSGTGKPANGFVVRFSEKQ